MGRRQRMSLVRWMILGFVLLGFFLLSQATLGLTGNQIIGDSQERLVQETAQVATANDILQRAIDLEGYAVSIVVTEDAAGIHAGILALAQQDVGAIQVAADSLLASADFDEKTTAGLQGLKSASDAYYVSLASLITAATDADEALAMLSEQTVPLATQLREAATTYRDMLSLIHI